MTPENRARLRQVLRDSLSHAVLPDAAGHPHGHGRDDGASHGLRGEAGPLASRALGSRALPGPTSASSEDETRASLVDRFRQEAEALTVRVSLAHDEAGAIATILSLLKSLDAKSVLAWSPAALGLPGLPDALRDAGIETVPQEVPVDPAQRAPRLAAMEQAAAGITGATAGLADTGSLVLTHGPGRGRLASLLPPIHIAILRCSAIVFSFADLLKRQPSLPEASSNLLLITGPSRTADIEMTLSRGVHGPKEVHVVLL